MYCTLLYCTELYLLNAGEEILRVVEDVGPGEHQGPRHTHQVVHVYHLGQGQGQGQCQCQCQCQGQG